VTTRLCTSSFVWDRAVLSETSKTQRPPSMHTMRALPVVGSGAYVSGRGGRGGCSLPQRARRPARWPRYAAGREAPRARLIRGDRGRARRDDALGALLLIRARGVGRRAWLPWRF